MNDLSTVLGGVIAAAAKSLPKTTGETQRFGLRLSGGSGATVLLADVSGSMAESAGRKTKAQHLLEALDECATKVPDATVIAFSSGARKLGSTHDLPHPSGGTDLAAGLRLAAVSRPSHTVVISDGQPDDEDAAIREAESLSGKIDVIYCGPDSDAGAIAFMRRLASVGCGSCAVHDVVKSQSGRGLVLGVRRALGLPAPEVHE